MMASRLETGWSQAPQMGSGAGWLQRRGTVFYINKRYLLESDAAAK